MNRRTTSSALLALLAASGALLGAAPSAKAALGQTASSVETDRGRIAARRSVRTLASYSVHTLTTANGAVVKEYVNAADKVFAVAWRGPARPDLEQLLGVHFQALQADNVREAGPRRRAPLRVDRTDLIVRTGGRPGAMWGLAALPADAPSDFVPDTLP